MISGLAVLWGEFVGNEHWKILVNDELERFVRGSTENINVIEHLSEMTEMRRKFYAIGNRDILQTQWEMRIADAMRNSDLLEYEYETYGRRVLKTDSPILSAFGGLNLDLVGISGSEEVYFAVCVNKHLSLDKKHKTSFLDWEEKSCENE